MNDKKSNKSDKKLNGLEAVSMMVDSVSTDVVISKRPGDEFSLSGLTGISIVDLYIILHGLQEILKLMKPMFKSQDDLKKCMGQMVSTIIDEIYECDEKKDEEDEK